jgi:hypothetical protein
MLSISWSIVNQTRNTYDTPGQGETPGSQRTIVVLPTAYGTTMRTSSGLRKISPKAVTALRQKGETGETDFFSVLNLDGGRSTRCSYVLDCTINTRFFLR